MADVPGRWRIKCNIHDHLKGSNTLLLRVYYDLRVQTISSAGTNTRVYYGLECKLFLLRAPALLLRVYYNLECELFLLRVPALLLRVYYELNASYFY